MPEPRPSTISRALAAELNVRISRGARVLSDEDVADIELRIGFALDRARSIALWHASDECARLAEGLAVESSPDVAPVLAELVEKLRDMAIGAAEHALADVEPPRIPDVFPAVTETTEHPCLLEVSPAHRSGRGRFWRPDGAGYTDDPGRAGIYKWEPRHGERAYFVDAVVVLAAWRAQSDHLTARIARWPGAAS